MKAWLEKIHQYQLSKKQFWGVGGWESDGAYIILEVASVCNPLELVSDTDIFTDPSERI